MSRGYNMLFFDQKDETMAIPKEYGKDGKPLPFKRQQMILERINSGEELSISELSREWGVSSKTLQRDFDKIVAGSFGIERAPDGRKFRKARRPAVKDDGEVIIDTIEALAKDIGGGFYSKTHRLLTQLRRNIQSPLYTRIDVEDISDRFEVIKTLEGAIAKKRSVTFEYTPYWSGEGKKGYEDVHPIKIVIFNGFWYLLAEHKNVYKKFYLKEIRNCNMEGETFHVDPKIIDRLEESVNVWFDPAAEPYEVTLWIDPDSVVFFERKPISKTQKLYKKPDGSAELIVKITDEDEILPVIKFYLPTIRILEPEGLRKHFESMLEKYLSLSQ